MQWRCTKVEKDARRQLRFRDRSSEVREGGSECRNRRTRYPLISSNDYAASYTTAKRWCSRNESTPVQRGYVRLHTKYNQIYIIDKVLQVWTKPEDFSATDSRSRNVWLRDGRLDRIGVCARFC